MCVGGGWAFVKMEEPYDKVKRNRMNRKGCILSYRELLTETFLDSLELLGLFSFNQISRYNQLVKI